MLIDVQTSDPAKGQLKGTYSYANSHYGIKFCVHSKERHVHMQVYKGADPKMGGLV